MAFTCTDDAAGLRECKDQQYKTQKRHFIYCYYLGRNKMTQAC